MPSPDSSSSAARRAYHRELRSVARVLRVTGFAFALLGVIGLVLGLARHAWWVVPSWVSLAIGAVLILAGGVRRVRDGNKAPDQL
jgi:hypothetical protein